MIYNYTKCESVIAKVLADLDSNETRNRITDMREWIFEAVDKIGAPMQYIDNECVLQIEDHQVPMPIDLHSLDAVAYSKRPKGPWVVMLPTTKAFKEPPCRHHHPEEPLMPRMITTQGQMYTDNTTRYIDRMILDKQLDPPEYFIKPGWMVINKPHGFVKLSYKSIAVDDRGYPLIPDLTSYQEAVYWYVVMKLSFPKFMRGNLSGKNSKYSAKYSQQSYFYIQQQWNFYRNQAYAEAMMPTAGDMKNIKHDWHKLIPDYDADEGFFENVNKEQKFYNDYYYGY